MDLGTLRRITLFDIVATRDRLRKGEPVMANIFLVVSASFVLVVFVVLLFALVAKLMWWPRE